MKKFLFFSLVVALAIVGLRYYQLPDVADTGPPSELVIDQEYSAEVYDLVFDQGTSETLAPTVLVATSEEGSEGGADWVLYLSLLVGVIEVVARSLPNPKITGLLGLAINILKNISDYLNRGKT